MLKRKVIIVEKYRLLFVGWMGMLLLLLNAGVYGQDQVVDSLQSLLKNQQVKNTDRVDVMIALGKKYYYIDIDTTLEIGKTALVESRNLDYQRGVAESNFLIGRISHAKGNNEKAYFHLNTAIDHFRALNAFGRMASVYNNIGAIYKVEGNFKDALENFRNAQNYASMVDDTFAESVSLIHIGIVYYRTGHYEQAIEAYINSIKLKEEIPDQYGIGLVSANLGNLFRDQEDYDKSLSYYEKGVAVFKEIDDPSNLAKAYNGIGRVYISLEKNDLALQNFENSLTHFRNVNDTLEMGNVLSNISRLYIEGNEFEKALKNQEEALELYSSIGNRDGVGQALCQIGAINFKLNDQKKAMEAIDRGLAIAIEIGDKQTQMEAFYTLYEFYETQHDIRSALNYFKKYTQTKDTLFNVEKTTQINLLERRYNLEKQEKENRLLVEQSKTQAALLEKSDLQRNILIGAIVVFLLFGMYFYRVYLQKKKTSELLFSRNEEINKKQAQIISINESLKKSQKQLHIANKELQKLNIGLESTVRERTAALELLNKELDTFLYQSSHALRRPVVSVMGLTQLARMEKKDDTTALESLYDKIDDTLVRMDLMLKKLVMASEINFIQVNPELIDFHEITHNIKKNLTEKLKVEGLEFTLSVANAHQYRGDRRLITVIFQNLIENAMVYYNQSLNRKPSVEISVGESETGTTIKIHDNGMGINKKVIASIFNMFTVGNEKGQGYGLGLYLVKKAVDKLKGTIKVDSKAKEYTTFIIDIPANDQNSSIDIDSNFEYVNQN